LKLVGDAANLVSNVTGIDDSGFGNSIFNQENGLGTV